MAHIKKAISGRKLRSWKRTVLCSLLSSLLSFLVTPASANSEKDAKKEMEREARALIAEAQFLEKSGDLLLARAKYAQSEALFETKYASEGVKHIDKEIHKKIESYLAQAGKSFSGAQFGQGANFLEQGLLLRPAEPALLFDAALVSSRSGDNARTLEYLDRASAAVYKRQDKALIQQWYSITTTGESPALLKGNEIKHLTEFNTLVSKLSEAITPAEMRVAELDSLDADAPDTSPQAHSGAKSPAADSLGSSICGQMPLLERMLPSSPAALFDRANCAELEGHLPEASRLLARYLEASPKAADAVETRARIATFEALEALPEPQKTQVTRHYAVSLRALFERKYDRALRELEQSEKIAPDFAPTQWRLALFREAMGDTKAAAEHFNRFTTLDTSEEGRQRVAPHLTALDDWRKDYDDEVLQAEDIITGMLQRGLGLTFAETAAHVRSHRAMAKKEGQRGAFFHKSPIRSGGFHIPYDYAREEFRIASEHLQSALAIFPLGAEANQLMAIVSLQANDGRSAIANFDAVASQNLPVSFYAEIRGEHADTAAKCEVRPGELRLIYLAKLDKKGNAQPAGAPAGDDSLGNLTPDPQDTEPADTGKTETRVIKITDMQKLETKGSVVVIKLANSEISLSPIYMTDEPPYEGPPSRRFANTYTRMFIRYADLEDAKLGTEGFTGWEKTKITYHFAQSAYNIATAAGPMGGIQIATEAYKISRLVQRTVSALRVAPSELRKRLVEEHGVFEAPAFKAIPLGPTPVEFRTALN
jgi:tetratricopeptide (TPR) repeat protein